MIGDTEPEDAYDASDPVPVRLELIARLVAAAAGDEPARRARRIRLAVRLLREMADDG